MVQSVFWDSESSLLQKCIAQENKQLNDKRSLLWLRITIN
jgi:hypothetical protein